MTTNPFGQQQVPAQPAQPQQPAQQPASDEFDQPDRGGDFIAGDTWKSWAGSLVLFEPIKVREGISTENGVTDGVTAHVHVIDVNGGPHYFENTLVLTPALRDACRERLGRRVLGRLKLVQSKGSNRSYVDLDDHTDADKETAVRYLAWRAAQSMQQPAQQQPAQQQAAPPPQQEQPPY